MKIRQEIGELIRELYRAACSVAWSYRSVEEGNGVFKKKLHFNTLVLTKADAQ